MLGMAYSDFFFCFFFAIILAIIIIYIKCSPQYKSCSKRDPEPYLWYHLICGPARHGKDTWTSTITDTSGKYEIIPIENITTTAPANFQSCMFYCFVRGNDEGQSLDALIDAKKRSPRRVAFADNLKHYVWRKCLNLTDDFITLDSEKDTRMVTYRGETKTLRNWLIQIGAELKEKDIYVWVKKALESRKHIQHKTPVIISDWRCPEEYEYITRISSGEIVFFSSIIEIFAKIVYCFAAYRFFSILGVIIYFLTLVMIRGYDFITGTPDYFVAKDSLPLTTRVFDADKEVAPHSSSIEHGIDFVATNFLCLRDQNHFDHVVKHYPQYKSYKLEAIVIMKDNNNKGEQEQDVILNSENNNKDDISNDSDHGDHAISDKMD